MSKWVAVAVLALMGCRTGSTEDLGKGQTQVDSDGDGFVAAEAGGDDCDDSDAEVFPGAEETCNGVDNDCNGAVDDGAGERWYPDADGDGFGDPEVYVLSCEPVDGSVMDDSDCDDTRDDVNPSAEEWCDEADNDCDDEVDEDVELEWYLDADADGWGRVEDVVLACSAPAGHVGVPGDCDDTDGAISPFAVELCDGVDNDCDYEVDEADAPDAQQWYADVDGDGYADLDDATRACEPPEGFVFYQPGDLEDCDDLNPDISPSAVEICDEVDNDCDGLIDDADASVADGSTWYLDGDGDGYGGATYTVEACLQPAGFEGSAPDCDDADPMVSPAGVEVCDGIDNDCNGATDEDDAGLTDAVTFYVDADGDGFGDGASTVDACEVPSGYADNSDDCDDGASDVNPAEAEVCDGIDNDCNGATDEDDAGLTDAVTFYVDADGDGFGDVASTVDACAVPSGYAETSDDCDDGLADINPDATEVCDEVDNDCDGLTDDDDPGLSGSGTSTWYADADGDGFGDPVVSTDACEAPSGFVDNSDDCDDADASDLDGDGLQDCDDDDIDGDGLPNELDGDPEDASVTRGATSGTGADGTLVVTGTEVMDDWTRLAVSASAGDSVITVDDATAFGLDDEVLILTQQGSDAGTYEFAFVEDMTGSSLELYVPLDNDFDSSSVVLVQRVPHYETVEVQSGGELTADAWAGAGGGVVVFRSLDSVSVAGSVAAAGIGYRGGDGVEGNAVNPQQGESWSGTGARGDTSANDGGGGSYPICCEAGESGGGGAFGTAGSGGTKSNGSVVTSGGTVYGDAPLSEWFLGSGGGGGTPDDDAGDGSDPSNISGYGGAGGGLVAIFAGGELSVTGSISVDGDDGDDAFSPSWQCGEIGAGGAGSGGLLYLAAPTLTLSGTVSAAGGVGGDSVGSCSSPMGSAFGGDGGDGRVRLDYDALTGTTSPSAGHVSVYED